MNCLHHQRIGAGIIYIQGLMWLLLGIYEYFETIPLYAAIIISCLQIKVGGIALIIIPEPGEYTYIPMIAFMVCGSFITGILLTNVPLYVFVLTAISYVLAICLAIPKSKVISVSNNYTSENDQDDLEGNSIVIAEPVTEV